MSRRLLTLVAPLLLYVFAVGWLTWPLAAHLGSHLPSTEGACRFDTLLLGWVLAWETHALTTAPLSLAQANIYHPAAHALFYCETGFGALPSYAPAFLVSGNPTLALNVTLLGGVALTAWTLHLVVRHWTSSHVAGFVGAWTFLMTRWPLWEWGPIAPNYVLLPYFPLIVLAASAPAARMRSALGLVPLIVLQGLGSIYLAAAVMLPLGLLAGARLLRPATRAAGFRLGVALGLAAALLFLAFSGYLIVRAENPDLSQQTVWRSPAQPPTALPWGVLGFLAPTAVPIAALAVVVLGMGALACARGDAPAGIGGAWLHAAFWSVAGIVLSLTPVVRWFDRPATLPTFYLTPLYGLLRVPARLGVAGLVGLALLAGLGWASVAACVSRALAPPTGRLVGGAAVLGLALLMYAEYAGLGLPGKLREYLASPARFHQPLPAAYPLAPAPMLPAPILEAVQRSDGPILEVPIGENALPWPPWPPFHAAAMYRSIGHWRPLVNGYSSYYPAGFPERMELAYRLPDADALAALRRETGLRTIIVHLNDLQPAERARWLTHPPPAGLQVVVSSGPDILFAVRDGEGP